MELVREVGNVDVVGAGVDEFDNVFELDAVGELVSDVGGDSDVLGFGVDEFSHSVSGEMCVTFCRGARTGILRGARIGPGA